jgi:phenylacetate-CoA ligase
MVSLDVASLAVELIELVAVRTDPQRVAGWFGSLPPSGLKTLQRARFRHALRLAAEHSPFYREQFRRHGINVKRIEHPSQLGDFYTTGEDLRNQGGSDFLAGRADTAFETTGTTSSVPKRVFFSRREIDEMGRITAVALYLLGLRRADRVVSAFDCSFWVSPWVLRAGLQYLHCFHVEAGKIEPLEFYERAAAYRPTVIFGEPSWIVRLSEIARGQGVWPLKFLFAGGEGITDEARDVVERTWSAPVYLSYGQTESFGALGSECRMKNGYHRNDLCFFFEVADPDSEGYGELVYTTLARSVMPLIRYRSSDVTRFIDEPCPCGLFAKRLAKVRSRCDEMVVCGMGNVGPWVFEEILRGIDSLAHEWQAIVSNEGQRDIVELHVEVKHGGRQEEVERALRSHLRERFPDFWKNLEMKLYELRVAACPSGSLREGRKLQRIVDERQRLARCVRVPVTLSKANR